MYQVGGTAAAGTVLGIAATQLPGPGQVIARQMLPFTGFACGSLFLIALVLVLVGLVMRKVGTAGA